MTPSSQRVYALVKPEVLIWARTSAGLSVEAAAKKAQVKPERIVQWETGRGRPTINQLRKLSVGYKRPLAVFFLPQPPKDFTPMRDFRKTPGTVTEPESPQLRLEIRKAHYRRDLAIELFELLGETPPAFSAGTSLSEDPEAAASRARQLLAVAPGAPATWRRSYDALNAWRLAIEQLGVLVFQARGVAVSEMRGFSIGETPLPAIVLNIKDSPRGRVFSMMHELVHLMLHQTGLCNFSEDPSLPPEERRIEVFCNRVAGAILVPRSQLLEHPLVRRTRRPRDWSDDELRSLAHHFQISEEAMLRRLLILGRTTEHFYRAKRKEFLKTYARLAEGSKTREGFAPPDRTAVATAGPAFVRLVLEGYHTERITASDLSDFLEVKLKHLPKIEAAMAAR